MKTKLFSFVSIFSIALFFAFEPFTITMASMTPQTTIALAQHQAGYELTTLAFVGSIGIGLSLALAAVFWMSKTSISPNIGILKEVKGSIGTALIKARTAIIAFAFFFTTAPTAYRQLE